VIIEDEKCEIGEIPGMSRGYPPFNIYSALKIGNWIITTKYAKNAVNSGRITIIVKNPILSAITTNHYIHQSHSGEKARS
jgi:hypothetical protein